MKRSIGWGPLRLLRTVTRVAVGIVIGTLMGTVLGTVLGTEPGKGTAFPPSASAAERSQCVICHTSGARLIQITRQLAAERPAAAPPASEGEG